MKLKKLLSAVLALLMIMSLAACGGQPGGENSSAPEGSKAPAPGAVILENVSNKVD